MKVLAILFTTVICSSPATVFAHEPAEGNIYGTFGPFVHRTLPEHHRFDSGYLTGFGLIADGDLTSHGSLEIGLFYLPQLFSIEQGDKVIVEKGERIYIATGYRQWFGSQFSVGAAFFSNYALSDAKTLRNDFGNDAPATSAQSMVKYGFDFSVQWEPWQKDRFSVVLDARYSLSVTSKPGEDENFYGLLVGIKYFIQSHTTPVSSD